MKRIMGQLLILVLWAIKILQFVSCRFLQHRMHHCRDTKPMQVAISYAFSISWKKAQLENVFLAGTTYWSYEWVAQISAIRDHNIYNK